MTTELTQARLFDALTYDPATGEFVSKSRGRKGLPAGCINGLGYQVIRIDKRLYAAHRLAWLYVHGKWPAGVIDHINGQRADNRMENLRDIGKPQNHQNLKGAQTNGTSGYLGVTYNAKRKHFIAQIVVGGRFNYIGSFPTPELAHEAYLNAKRVLHPCGTL
ncbi:HNH endonuclease signature motif containing protein [Variovorax sp. N23]|uniref:HNH endonuclease signature motif containing protein n=1 Tax=Variovorax sp. N23 TaxID=2980555 RepID=UPI0021CA3235|nr:HNH endonuclease signature motif containing protein [Variovorax sp. N23]MCU4119362.1 HNH endonuclease [Variovorax sp. N23]